MAGSPVLDPHRGIRRQDRTGFVAGNPFCPVDQRFHLPSEFSDMSGEWEGPVRWMIEVRWRIYSGSRGLEYRALPRRHEAVGRMAGSPVFDPQRHIGRQGLHSTERIPWPGNRSVQLTSILTCPPSSMTCLENGKALSVG